MPFDDSFFILFAILFFPDVHKIIFKGLDFIF